MMLENRKVDGENKEPKRRKKILAKLSNFARVSTYGLRTVSLAGQSVPPGEGGAKGLKDQMAAARG